jgi:pimeloyl-ACP methyl ester carboxylesterase
MPSGTTWTDRRSGSTAWRELGDGPPLVFLHGLGGTRSSWGPQLAGLSDRWRCIAWDMPGYGDSAPADPLTYEAISDRLVALLDDLDIESADVVGLSFGGMQALHAALRHPGRLARLVLADTSAAFGMDGTRPEKWQAIRLAPIDAGQTPGSIAASVLDRIAARPLAPGIRRDLIDAFARIPAAGFRAAVGCLPGSDVRSQLHLISQPALVIVGELDRETPVAYSQALAGGLPDARLVVLDGVGHLTPSEDPASFNRHVRAFLAGTGPEARR